MLRHLLFADRFRKHLGILFAAIHVVWFFAATATLGRHPHAAISFLPDGSTDEALFAGRPFHFEYEKPIMKLLIWGDTPAVLLLIPVEHWLPSLVRNSASDVARSYIDAGLLLFVGTVQWALVGHFISRRIAKRRKPLKPAH